MDKVKFFIEFCELIPEYCKTVSSLGIRYVCIIHKNSNFMAEKFPDILMILML